MPLSFKDTGNATGSGTAGVKVLWGWMVVIADSSFLRDDGVLGGVAGIILYFIICYIYVQIKNFN